MAVEQFDGKIEVRDTGGSSVRITLNGDTGNITSGNRGADGDLVLRGVEQSSSGPRVVNRIHLDAEKGNVWIGGSGADGDIVIFPQNAAHREDVADSTIHLDGDVGAIKLKGGIIPYGSPARCEYLGQYSVDQGATRHFQGFQRFGFLEFTHTHDPAPHDREKLMEIRIFNQLLHDNSIVFVTPHTSTPCMSTVGKFDRPLSHTQGEGHYIGIFMTPKVPPGRRLRIVYWIMN